MICIVRLLRCVVIRSEAAVSLRQVVFASSSDCWMWLCSTVSLAALALGQVSCKVDANLSKRSVMF